MTRKRSIKLLSLVLALLAMVLLLQEYVFRDYWQFGQASLRVKGFYREPKDSLEVVLIGDSTFYAGYSAAYAYASHGMHSYCLAIGSNVCVTWQPLTEEILRRQDPQLIVVELGSCTYPDLQEKYETTPTIHILLDNMPTNGNRLRMIRREVVGRYHDDPLEYLFPLIRYHNDWSSFGELVQRAEEMVSWKYKSRNVLKGTVGRVSVKPPPRGMLHLAGDRSTEPLAPESEEVLRAYLDYCRENDVNVLFITTPVRITRGDEFFHEFRRVNRAGEIVREYGFDYVNFHDYADEIGLDPAADYYNDGHMNYHGQIKYTDFLSRFLLEHYGVTPAALPQEQQAAWDRTGDYVQRLYAYMDSMPPTDRSLFMENREIMDILNDMGPGETG